MTPDLQKQWFHLVQAMGIDEFPVIEPQTRPKIVHEHRKTGHDGKYTPWATELVATTRCESAKRTRNGRSNGRVMFIEFLVPLFTLISNFDEVFLFGRLR